MLALAALVASCSASSGSGGALVASSSSSSGPTAEGSSGTDGVAACEAIRTGPWTAVPSSADLVDLARTAKLPRIPVADIPAPVVTMDDDFTTIESYLAPSNVPDKAARAQVMADAGYRGGTDVTYLQDPQEHGAKVQRFRDAAGALAYLRAHLTNVCPRAVTTVELPDHAGLVYRDPVDAVRAIFVLGDSEVDLLVCGCIPGDQVAIATAWYQRLAHELGSGPAKEIR